MGEEVYEKLLCKAALSSGSQTRCISRKLGRCYVPGGREVDNDLIRGIERTHKG